MDDLAGKSLEELSQMVVDLGTTHQMCRMQFNLDKVSNDLRTDKVAARLERCIHMNVLLSDTKHTIHRIGRVESQRDRLSSNYIYGFDRKPSWKK